MKWESHRWKDADSPDVRRIRHHSFDNLRASLAFMAKDSAIGKPSLAQTSLMLRQAQLYMDEGLTRCVAPGGSGAIWLGDLASVYAEVDQPIQWFRLCAKALVQVGQDDLVPKQLKLVDSLRWQLKQLGVGVPDLK